MPRRVRFILFCDQIRHESSNKSIYIGTYGNAMLVDGSFPAVLPSFAVAISIDPPEDRPGPDEKVTVELEIPGLETQKVVHNVDRKHPLDSVTVHLNFVPFVVPKAGAVKARVSLPDGTNSESSIEIMTRQAYKEHERTTH